MYDIFSFVQILGYLAFIVFVISFLQHRDVLMKGGMACANLIIVWHLFLLGDPSGALLKVVSASRDIGSLMPFRRYLVWVFLGVYLFLTPRMLAEPIAIFGFLGGLVALFVTYFLSGVRMRFGLMISTSLWLLYSIQVGSYGGVLQQSFLLCSLAFTVRKMLKK